MGGHSAVSTQITFESPSRIALADFATALRNAWLAVRYDVFPEIAARASCAVGKEYDVDAYWLHYPVGDRRDAERWALMTVVEHAPTTAKGFRDELLHGFTKPNDPFNAWLHWAPDIGGGGRTFHAVYALGLRSGASPKVDVITSLASVSDTGSPTAVEA